MVGVMGGKICCERGGHWLRFLRTWCVCLSWEAVSWSRVFFLRGRCSWLAWEGRGIQTSTERTGPFKFFAFPTLTSSSVRWVVRDVSYIISDDMVMSPPKAAGHGPHLLVYYPSS